MGWRVDPGVWIEASAKMAVLTLAIWKTLTLYNATFCPADLDSFCMLDGLGLHVTGQRLEPDRAVLEYRVTSDDR